MADLNFLLTFEIKSKIIASNQMIHIGIVLIWSWLKLRANKNPAIKGKNAFNSGVVFQDVI